MILQSSNIGLERGKGVSLRFPDLNIAPGESLLLLGPSGCGKTTLLSILAGLITPTTGTVLLQGQDFHAMAPRLRDGMRGRTFGFIFQTLHLLPSLNVRDNVLLAARMAGVQEDAGRADALLESLGLKDKILCKPHSLSQGERQRVAIARAILNRPAILVADEPTSALDDRNALITMKLIRTQARETGAALIFATHDSRITGGFDRTIQLSSHRDIAA